MNAPVLELKNVGGGYPTFSLSGVNLTLNAGDCAGIIGPNGSGKSTLLRMISGELRTGSGEILLENTPLKDFSLREKARRVAVVPQQQAACDMSLLDYVLLGRTPYKSRFQFFENRADVQRAEHNIERTGLARYRNRSMTCLSGGERQLAVLARALTQEPTLLLLDEPTSQLDIGHQAQILDLIRSLSRDPGLTVLMIIHDLNLASNYCNRLILMNEGKIHLQGSPEEILTYQTVEEVYKTPVVTAPNPVTGRPSVFLVPGDFTN